jgi:dienelactone hydrolase
MRYHFPHIAIYLLAMFLVIGLVDDGFGEDQAEAYHRQHGYQHVGVDDYLPVFWPRLAARFSFPYAWQEWRKRSGHDFDAWRKEIRQRVRDRFLAAPPTVPFEPEIIGNRKRDGYTSYKIVFNLTGDSRVLAYYLVPDSPGPHPAVLLLHDHGAEFRIGKEKSVEPWEVSADKAALARDWVDEVYGGRFVGDALAARGYVCLAYDALNWSDRGGAGFDGQQALASNLLHLGMSFAGLIAHEDLRGAAFLASRPEVDQRRIAALGHSMGAFRTWQVAAMSDHIAAGVSCCWMATVQGLMVPGNNQTKGQSSFTMTHPGLFNELDYPDVASLACPKPMLFFAGEQDTLFPVPRVKEAFEKMHRVWDSQGANDKLVTKIWPVPHLFNAAMQDEAFAWLDRYLRPRGRRAQPPGEATEPSSDAKFGIIETTLVDPNASYYGTFQSHNQKVVATPDGIFMTYSRNRVPSAAADAETCLWRLVRSTDGGQSFQTAYESINGTRAPVLETDEAGNLYMAHPDWNDKAEPFYFYRFNRGGDYGEPTIATIPDVACGAKYAMAYDATRQQFYIAAQFGQLLTVSPAGKLLRRQAAFRPSGLHAATQYPHLVVSPDGVLHLAMTTVGPNQRGRDIYWDIHYMNSPDGGLTWHRMDGALLPEAPVPDDTGPTDRISLDDEFEVNSWLANMLVKDGKVHFIYQGNTMHYLRYDLATGRKDVVLDGRQFGGTDTSLCHISGLLACRLDQTGSPLYCVARDPDRATLACLVSCDNGQSWADYALAVRTFADNYATGGTRQITDDGYVIGSFTERIRLGGHCQGVWFYRLKAKSPETNTINMNVKTIVPSVNNSRSAQCHQLTNPKIGMDER